MSTTINFVEGSSYRIKYNGNVVDAVYVGKHSDEYGLFSHDGKTVARSFKRVASESAVQAASQNVEAAAVEASAPQSRSFDVNTRFKFIDGMVNMIVRGYEKSLVISGSGGVGKSHSVFNCLRENDLGDADYTKISGHATPRSLYSTMYSNSDKLIVFDDCDSILNNETCQNILKAALENRSQRVVSWCTTKDDAGLPSHFVFNGRIIFISNYTLKDIPQPIISRAIYVDVTMTPDEKIDRIREISPNLCPDLNAEERAECLDLLSTLRYEISDLNLRTMMKVASIRKANPAIWRDMATYMVTAKLTRQTN